MFYDAAWILKAKGSGAWVVLTNFSALMGCNPTYLLCYGLKSMEDLTKFLECKANMYLIVLVNISF